jgi:hypothetical protein
MNVDTGELRRIAKELSPEFEKELREQNFTPVPKEHQEEANKELGDSERVFVNMKKNTPLVKWAKSIHHKNSKKKKSKTAELSRRKNRK